MDTITVSNAELAALVRQSLARPLLDRGMDRALDADGDFYVRMTQDADGFRIRIGCSHGGIGYADASAANLVTARVLALHEALDTLDALAASRAARKAG